MEVQTGAPSKPRQRCAVYCRVSSDERLDQEFNSIDAQKEAGHAYIPSRRIEGWTPVADDYDDPGYSGGNTERPALRRLLADIEAGRIDIVVVYKIDRLTRSLADFSRMVEVFERQGVSFVPVTQHFNTTTSMGRLMLNVLLSFAQFEREVTAERIRDKIAAALNVEGITTKAWITQDGRQRPGARIDKKHLHHLLRNRIYLGEISHKGSWHPGAHPPTIELALWEAVHAVLARDARSRAIETRLRERTDALLRGLLYDAEGEKMYPTYVKKNGRQYRYYFSKAEARFGAGHKTSVRLPAEEIEAATVVQIRTVLTSPEAIAAIWLAVQAQTADLGEAQVVVALGQLGSVWEQLFPAERHRIVQRMIERVELAEGGLKIRWRALGWKELLSEFAPRTIGAELVEMETAA